MARIDEIQQLIIDDIQARPELEEMNSTSVTAVWRLWTRIAAFFSELLENLFIAHKSDVDETIANLKPHSPLWYQNKALMFQYGSDLEEGKDTYDNTGLTDEQIEEQLIIAQSAVTEENGLLVIKIAREVDDELVPLELEQYDAFTAYMNEIKDAGVKLVILSFEADKLILAVDIYYNPLILNAAGQRIDQANDTPVQDAAKAFLRNLPFDGLYVRDNHEEHLKNIDGVVIAKVNICQAARFDNLNFQNVDVKYQPYSGFLRLYDDTDLVINFVNWDA